MNQQQGYSSGQQMIEEYLNKVFSGIAQKTSVPVEKVRVGFKINPEKDGGVFTAYNDLDMVDENFRPEKYMGVKIDLSGMVELSRMFLSDSILQLSKKLSCKQEELEVIIWKNGDIRFAVLKNNQKVPESELGVEFL